MATRRSDEPSSQGTKKTPKGGNYISEWFGYRIFPAVSDAPAMVAVQRERRCPFLSASTGEFRECIKAETSKGVCSISTITATRQDDWLVCPYRAVQPDLLEAAARRLFDVAPGMTVLIASAPSLEKTEVRAGIKGALKSDQRAFVFFQDKLGGEISLPRTDRSPELAFDITLVEIKQEGDELHIGQYGILEVQTMDFHGTYRHAVQNLTDALRLHDIGFPAEVSRNHQWLSDNMEGPNIANVFKRTFYQMAFKFQMGLDKACAGCVLAISESVWLSWQRHLGAPSLTPAEDGSFLLRKPRPQLPPAIGPEVPASSRIELSQPTGELASPAWIYVFEFDTGSDVSPNRLAITKQILTDAHSLAYFALDVAPTAAVASAAEVIRVSLIRKLSKLWPLVVS
ncbi:MAG: hypothetical protein ABR611_10340 [Chthoniobacterales bacterium]